MGSLLRFVQIQPDQTELTARIAAAAGQTARQLVIHTGSQCFRPRIPQPPGVIAMHVDRLNWHDAPPPVRCGRASFR